MGECLFAGEDEEHLIFLWSFKESGLLLNPYDFYNDVVVTTDRLRLASEAYYKTFDCRTCLCWGALYCAFVKRVCGMDSRPKMRSFLNFSHLEAFSTEHSQLPPLFPIECPCYTSCCDLLTSCVTCDRMGCLGAGRECCGTPSTASPKSQIWLKWLQRYAKAVQPDMVLSVRPYSRRESSPGLHPPDWSEIQLLRQLMHWILAEEEEEQARHESLIKRAMRAMADSD